MTGTPNRAHPDRPKKKAPPPPGMWRHPSRRTQVQPASAGPLFEKYPPSTQTAGDPAAAILREKPRLGARARIAEEFGISTSSKPTSPDRTFVADMNQGTHESPKVRAVASGFQPTSILCRSIQLAQATAGCWNRMEAPVQHGKPPQHPPAARAKGSLRMGWLKHTPGPPAAHAAAVPSTRPIRHRGERSTPARNGDKPGQ